MLKNDVATRAPKIAAHPVMYTIVQDKYCIQAGPATLHSCAYVQEQS